MRLTYCGKKTLRDVFGRPLKTLPPCAEISFKENAIELMRNVLAKTGYAFDEFGNGDGTCFAQVVVSDRAEYEEFVQSFKALHYRETHAVGDTVFVIVKDMSTFRPEIVKGKIAQMDDDNIRVSEPKVYRGVAHAEWTFPWSSIGREVFTSQAGAEKGLKKLVEGA